MHLVGKLKTSAFHKCKADFCRVLSHRVISSQNSLIFYAPVSSSNAICFLMHKLAVVLALNSAS